MCAAAGVANTNTKTKTNTTPNVYLSRRVLAQGRSLRKVGAWRSARLPAGKVGTSWLQTRVEHFAILFSRILQLEMCFHVVLNLVDTW